MHNTPETQDLFWDLLSEAEKECGFNIDNSMIYVEATTTGSGNFTLIVTKTNEKPINLNSTLSKRKNIKLKRKVRAIENMSNIFEFDNFDDICEFSKTIDIGIIEENSLFLMNDKYYLKVESMPFNNIIEYATVCPSFNILEAELNEYGKIIIHENALQTIHQFFNKRRKK